MKGSESPPHNPKKKSRKLKVAVLLLPLLLVYDDHDGVDDDHEVCDAHDDRHTHPALWPLPMVITSFSDSNSRSSAYFYFYYYLLSTQRPTSTITMTILLLDQVKCTAFSVSKF